MRTNTTLLALAIALAFSAAAHAAAPTAAPQVFSGAVEINYPEGRTNFYCPAYAISFSADGTISLVASCMHVFGFLPPYIKTQYPPGNVHYKITFDDASVTQGYGCTLLRLSSPILYCPVAPAP